MEMRIADSAAFLKPPRTSIAAPSFFDVVLEYRKLSRKRSLSKPVERAVRGQLKEYLERRCLRNIRSQLDFKGGYSIVKLSVQPGL